MKEVDRIKAAERRRREMEERLLKRMVDSEGRLQEAKAEEVSRYFLWPIPKCELNNCAARARVGATANLMTELTRSALSTSPAVLPPLSMSHSPHRHRVHYWRASKIASFLTFPAQEGLRCQTY